MHHPSNKQARTSSMTRRQKTFLVDVGGIYWKQPGLWNTSADSKGHRSSTVRTIRIGWRRRAIDRFFLSHNNPQQRLLLQSCTFSYRPTAPQRSHQRTSNI